jgi:hypothetical protein
LPLTLTERDLLLLDLIDELRGVPVEYIEERFFSFDPYTKKKNTNPKRACDRRLRELARHRYVRFVREFDGERRRQLVVLETAAEDLKIGERSSVTHARRRRPPARHGAHHVKTLDAVASLQRSLEARGGRIVRVQLDSDMRATLRAGRRTKKGDVYDVMPDAVLTVEMPGRQRVDIAVEYVTSKYTDADIRAKHRAFSKYAQTVGVSRSGFYASLKRPECARAKEDRQLRVLCKEAHARSRGNYGSVRVHRALKKQGFHVSRKRVVRLMQHEGIAGKRRRRWTRTTESQPGVVAAPNILNREFSPPAPNKVWAGDVTFLRTPFGFVYLAVVIDLFSRFVVGWAVSAVNDRNLVLAALNAALRRRCPGRGLLHHSDQGSPYTSEDYQQALDDNGIICSISRRGNCYDNAAV